MGRKEGDSQQEAEKAAVSAIAAARRCVVFSGAGASADSGIGTFRGAGGAWSGITGRLSLVWGGTPIGWRLTPGLVWSGFVTNFYGPIVEAKPHDGLFALAELQKHRLRDSTIAGSIAACYSGNAASERMKFI